MTSKTLLGATALTLVMSLPAMADLNSANLKQAGNNNTVNTSQSHIDHAGVGNPAPNPGPAALTNQIGGDDLAVVQEGNANNLHVAQKGEGNKVGTTGAGFRQEGYSNTATIIQGADGLESNRSSVQNVLQSNDQNTINSGNTLYIAQNLRNSGTTQSSNNISGVTQISEGGAGNTAIMVQVAAANNIKDVLQRGAENLVNINQNGNAHAVKASTQIGSGNDAYIVQTGTAQNTNSVSQRGTDNLLTLGLAGNGNGLRFGNWSGTFANYDQGLVQATVAQEGSSNTINADFSGRDNGYAYAQNGTENYLLSTNSGDDNQIAMKQNGHNNDIYSGVNNGDKNMLSIGQRGDSHEASAWISGDSNKVGLTQELADHTAAISVSGDRNDLRARQDSQAGASGNTLQLTVSGNENNLITRQYGENTIIATIAGSHNNRSGSFTGAAANLAGGADIGELTQYGLNNEIALTVLSDYNLFSMVQNGQDNKVSGLISGNENQAYIAQDGNNNNVTFAQVGAHNNLAAFQYGAGNTMNVNQ